MAPAKGGWGGRSACHMKPHVTPPHPAPRALPVPPIHPMLPAGASVLSHKALAAADSWPRGLYSPVRGQSWGCSWDQRPMFCSSRRCGLRLSCRALPGTAVVKAAESGAAWRPHTDSSSGTAVPVPSLALMRLHLSASVQPRRKTGLGAGLGRYQNSRAGELLAWGYSCAPHGVWGGACGPCPSPCRLCIYLVSTGCLNIT